MKKIALTICLLMLGLSSVKASQLQLETIGAASGSSMYLTYISIGVTADAYEKKVYTKESAKAFILSIVKQAEVVKGYLQKLIDEKELTGEDVSFVADMIDAYGLLLNEGNAFLLYVDSGKKENVDEFHKNRKAAWEKIEKLLGIGKK
jgi:hypothetical protein